MNITFLLFVVILAAQVCYGQFKANYDEDKIPDYSLPEILRFNDGTKVVNAEQWPKRRQEILSLFEKHIYGKSPDRPKDIWFDIVEQNDNALGGIAIRKQIRVGFTKNKSGPAMEMLLYLPKNSKPKPVFLMLNFKGNHTISPDPAIRLTSSWVRNDSKLGISDNKTNEKARGVSSSRWPVEMLIKNGYGLATIYYGDIDPDFDDGFKNGVHSLFDKAGSGTRTGDAWGSIAAWSWGLGRAMDYLEKDRGIDNKRVVVLGHSRLGKAALWAGATDERFAIVISNNSGCGGAALFKREIGETLGRMNENFPHWLCKNSHNISEKNLPVDQHMLIALMAPRPVYVASAQQDRWADSRGQFLSVYHAGDAYKLLGKTAIDSNVMPGLNKPIHNTTGFHIRPGKHDVTDYDWKQYIKFADKHFGR